MARRISSEYPRSFRIGVSFVRMIVEARPTIVVEIVNETDDAPEFFLFGSTGRKFTRVRAHASLNGESVFPQTFALSELS
jgi:hypothetical protein